MDDYYLYIVDYWSPSEYGGIIILIAQNDSCAFNLLTQEESLLQYEEYNHLIMEKLLTAQKFKLTEKYESGILEVFVT